MRRLRRELTEIVGNPNAIQKQLIERCVRLSMAVELLDEKLLTNGHLSDRDQRQYLAWSNSLSRTLRLRRLPLPDVAFWQALSETFGEEIRLWSTPRFDWGRTGNASVGNCCSGTLCR